MPKYVPRLEGIMHDPEGELYAEICPKVRRRVSYYALLLSRLSFVFIYNNKPPFDI
jgi:hypothetical protein